MKFPPASDHLISLDSDLTEIPLTKEVIQNVEACLLVAFPQEWLPSITEIHCSQA